MKTDQLIPRYLLNQQPYFVSLESKAGLKITSEEKSYDTLEDFINETDINIAKLPGEIQNERFRMVTKFFKSEMVIVPHDFAFDVCWLFYQNEEYTFNLIIKDFKL